MTRWLTETEQRAWRAWLEAIRLLLPRLDRQLQRDCGLTLADYEILVRLSETPDGRLRMSELSGQTMMSRSRLSHQIDRMQTTGLLTRQACPNDGRGAFAVLTEHGKTVLADAAPGHADVVKAAFFDPINEDQIAALTEVFTTIVAQMVAGPDSAEDIAPRAWGKTTADAQPA